MAWSLRAMRDAQIPEVIINTHWLGEQIHAAWGDGNAETPPLRYSDEGRDFGRALETAGGIARALPGLPDAFWVAAADVWAPQFTFDAQCVAQFRQSRALAHLWLVPNPSHHPDGDYSLDERGRVQAPGTGPRLTYSTIGLYRRALFEAPWLDIPPGNPEGVVAALAPLQRAAMAHGLVTGMVYDGEWVDVGTPERLQLLNETPS
jgi:MurNAc alpha-1-phosphate uridylyltransferase